MYVYLVGEKVAIEVGAPVLVLDGEGLVGVGLDSGAHLLGVVGADVVEQTRRVELHHATLRHVVDKAQALEHVAASLHPKALTLVHECGRIQLLLLLLL